MKNIRSPELRVVGEPYGSFMYISLVRAGQTTGVFISIQRLSIEFTTAPLQGYI